MSDRMTNIDESDVLASVRRLVSKTSSPKQDQVEDQSKSFLLTPNFRVSTPATSQAPAIVRSIRSSVPDTSNVVLKFSSSELDHTQTPESVKAYRLTPAERVPEEKLKPEVEPAVQSLEQRIAELEASVVGYEAEWEPDGAEASHKETPEIMPVGFSDSMPRAKFDARFPVSDAPVDQSALRSLISEMINEELKGELGEKMTRNVRRLVRREVQSAITLKDFE